MNFFSKLGAISSWQYGFRKGLGKSDLLMKLHNDWSSTVASGGMVHVLAINIAGAFDKVSHRGVQQRHADSVIRSLAGSQTTSAAGNYVL